MRTEPIDADLGSVHNSIIADRMTVHGSIHIKECNFRVGSTSGGGALRFAGATVGSQFVMSASSAGHNLESASAILQNMKVSGKLEINGMRSAVPQATNSTLSGDIIIAGVSASKIVLRDTSVRGVDLRGASAHVEISVGPNVSIQDRVEANGCRAGGFSLSQSCIGRLAGLNGEAGLFLRNSVLHGDLEIGAGTDIRGQTDLHHICVDGDILITGSRSTVYTSMSHTPCGAGQSPTAGSQYQTRLRSGRSGRALVADFSSVRGKLHIDQVAIDGSITLESANVGQVCLSRSEVGANCGYAINANRAQVRGPVVLGPRLVARGPVRIEDAAAGFIDVCAKIISKGEQSDHGECSCEPATKTSNYALSLARTNVASDVRFNRDATLDGALSLFASRIGGSLELDSTKIAGYDENGNSLVASRVRIENSIMLGDEFYSDGGLEFRGGQVGGELSIGADAIGANTSGFSVLASFLTTGGGIRLCGKGPNGLHLAGAIALRNASTRDLSIRSIRAYADPKGIAVIGDGMNAVRAIKLDDFHAAGKISFAQCEAAEFGFAGTIAVADRISCTALDLCGASISRHVTLNNLQCTGHVKLRGATFGDLTMLHADIRGTPDCHHSLLGPKRSFSLDANGMDVKNDLDISHLSTADNVLITGVTVRRVLTMKDLSGIEGRLHLNGTAVETVIFLEDPAGSENATPVGTTTL